MFFLLRCIFWLSIVYGSILLPKTEWSRLPQDAVRMGQDGVDRAARKAMSTATLYCRAASSGCLGEAARLTALIDAAGTSAASAEPTGSVPVPVRRPPHIGAARAAHGP